jgi:hypothetical protein
MKLKKLCLLPHLNCLSSHVAIGDKVGQRCSFDKRNQLEAEKISLCSSAIFQVLDKK